jgi:hypothetical protein
MRKKKNREERFRLAVGGGGLRLEAGAKQQANSSTLAWQPSHGEPHW